MRIFRDIFDPKKWREFYLSTKKNSDQLICKEFIDYDAMDKSTRKREDLEKTLKRGCDVLEELGVKYWIGRGSLLGFHRDNDFLPNDIDLDIDVYTDVDIYKIIQKMPFDALFVTSFNGQYMQFAFLDRETDVLFDIWFFHDKDDKLYNRNLFGHFWLPLEEINNLRTISFNGREYPAPDSEWYCQYWYGENWRFPKKYGKDWTIDYRKDCKGFIYTGSENAQYLRYF